MSWFNVARFMCRFIRLFCYSLLLVCATGWLITKPVQAVAYNMTTDNTWCGSYLETYLNDEDFGVLSTFGYAIRYLLDTNCSQGKLSLLTTNQWTNYQSIYKTAVGGTSYAPTNVDAFWLSSPDTSGTTNAYNMNNAATGATGSLLVTNTGPDALTTFNLDPNLTVSSGTGTSTDPYILNIVNTVLAIFPENARMSFLGEITSGNATGSSVVKIKSNFGSVSGPYSVDAAQLQTGDQMRLGVNNYYVATTSGNLAADQVALTTSLKATDVATNNIFYNKMSGPIKLSFFPDEGVVDGSFQINFPAAANNANDGIPDSGTFDFNQNLANVTCPVTTRDYQNFTAGSATAVTNVSGQTVQQFTCTYTGLSTTDELIFYVNNLINPAPNQANPETWDIDLQGISLSQLSSTSAVIKTGYGSDGVGSAVKTNVNVLPYVTFSLSGVNNAQNVCHTMTTVSTSGLEVPFNTIASDTFSDAAQRLTVSTNAQYGYVVTAIATDQFGIAGQSCGGYATVDNELCIPFIGDSYTENTIWNNSTTQKGYFGFTMNVVAGDDYPDNDGTPNVQTAFNSTNNHYRGFPTTAGNQWPLQIINNLRSTTGDTIDICYRVIARADNLPGNYQTEILYTLTASF